MRSQGQLEIHRSSYNGNKAQRLGGAINFGNTSNVSIISSTFTDNRAEFGGSLYGDSNNNLSTVQSTFADNYAEQRGGVVFVRKHNHVNVEESRFSENIANLGGALYLERDNTVTMRGSNFTSNQAENSAAALALINDDSATIVEAIFSNNSAPGASVMLLSVRNGVTIRSSNFSVNFVGNQAMDYGSAIYLYERSTLSIENSSLLENKGAWYGGALGANVFSNITIMNSFFLGNDARWGGAIYIECNANVSISDSRFLKNNASQGGAIRVGMNCDMTIRNSTFEQNTANNGGCMYVDSSTIEIKASNFSENESKKLGGCFSTESSSITLTNSVLSKNIAEEGGGVHASSRTFLNMQETTISSNSANSSAGGLALMYDSRLLCFMCKFMKNTAKQGGGLYIQSHTKQLVVARLQNSIFEGNKATVYGGGMVVETIESKRVNCTEPLAPCNNVLLFGTDFTNNWANLSGSAILATTPYNILVDCEMKTKHASSVFISRIILSRLQTQNINMTDPKKLCPSWQGNSLPPDAPGDVIGTFGHYLNLVTVSKDGPQIAGNHTAGFVLPNIRSAEQFPIIIVQAIDAFGNTPAPLLLKEDTLQLSSSNEFLKDTISVSFVNMTCVISSISASAPKGDYKVDIIPKAKDVLKRTTLTISITDCGINEELKKNTNVCHNCRNGSYNFDPHKVEGCTSCPKHATCEGLFVMIKAGYWQKSPCHDKVKKCMVERACDYPNRTKAITNFTQDFADCDFNDTSLEQYGEIQCRKGYKGALCGSCEKSYGLSSNLECSKCSHAIVVVLRSLGAVVYLLVGTIITIKGVISSTSSQQNSEDVETPLLAPSSSALMDVGSSSRVRADVENGNQDVENGNQDVENGNQDVENGNQDVENGNQDVSHPMVVGDENSPNLCSKNVDEVEVTKLKLISLNYFQVTSTAAGMDVEWTKKILDMLEGLNILGAATTESVSYSFDCVFSSASNDSKTTWRLLFSLLIPIIVILLLSLYWGYKSWRKYSEKWDYCLRRLTLTVITVTYATHFDLTQVAMRTFSCVVVYANFDPFSIASTKYWIGDTSVECYKDAHVVLICISLVIVTLVTIGFPTFSSFTLNQRKSEVRDTSTWTHDTLGFLGGPFKQRFIYWECVTMIKKAILSILIVFSYSLEVQAQGLLILLVLVFFLYIHFTSSPYDEEFHSLNYYESGSLLVSCVTYTMVQFFSIERFSQVARSIISLSIIAINVGFMCLMLYKIMKDLAHLLRALLRSRNIHVPTNMNMFSLIKVYSSKKGILQDAT